MPEDKNCKLIQAPRSSDQKKKKKKKTRKKGTASSTALDNTEKPQAGSSPVSPQTSGQPQGQLLKLTAAGKKNGLPGSGRGKKRHKDSPALLTESQKSNMSGSQGLSVQARESLRWEGVLQDPQAEAKRLDAYRANRRQRYIAHRETLIKETQVALRQTYAKESKATVS
ncbi:protein LIAT1 [Mugil cephalus]|uniref:protein LIAT1 n=1 Tax=Mugil cephalus TaxID=48193 RepID=UPI001FB653EB|nr:protein LIAT1 [Mugil cephalus]